MTLEEFNKMVATVKSELDAELEASKEMHKNGVLDVNEYNPLLLDRKCIQSEELEDFDSLEDVASLIEDFKKQCYEHKREIGLTIRYRVSAEPYRHEGSAYVEANNFLCTWYTVKQEIGESIYKRVIKDKIKELLKPVTARYLHTVDCKLLELFKAGTIDWKTLQKLVYSNCEF